MNTDSKEAKVAWEAVCKPMDENGLGIRNLEEWDMANIWRHIWFLFGDGGTIFHRYTLKKYMNSVQGGRTQIQNIYKKRSL